MSLNNNRFKENRLFTEVRFLFRHLLLHVLKRCPLLTSEHISVAEKKVEQVRINFKWVSKACQSQFPVLFTIITRFKMHDFKV